METQEKIAKITTLLSVIFDNNITNITLNSVLQVMALFDSCHDFGKYSICYDTLSAAFRNDTNTSKYTNQRMAFSALSKLVFNIGGDQLSRGYGSLRTPAQYYSSALQAKDLENSFMLYAENHRGIAVNSERFILRSVFESDEEYYNTVHNKLKNHYHIVDNTLIPLLVDTQKKIYKHDHFKQQFMVAILRESVYDAASKLKPDETDKNVYYETRRNHTDIHDDFYTYNKDQDDSGFVGNIPVSLGPITVDDNKYKMNVRINNKVIDVIGNDGANHKNSITVLHRLISANQKNPCQPVKETMYAEGLTYPYSGYVGSNINTTDSCREFNDNNINFTQKRTGDGNQGSICKLVNDGRVSIRVTRNDRVYIDLGNKLVLVTIDRMLYAIALMLDIPVIYEHKDSESMKCYIPPATPPPPPAAAAPAPVLAKPSLGELFTNFFTAAQAQAAAIGELFTNFFTAAQANTSTIYTGSDRSGRGGSTSITSNNPNIIQKITNQTSLKNNSHIQNKEQSGGDGLGIIEYVSSRSSFVNYRFRQTFRIGTELDTDTMKHILDTPNYILALTPFIHVSAYGYFSSDFKNAFERIVAEPYITCSNTVDGIDDPVHTNFLRNDREDEFIVMNNLIGQDNHDIDIINLHTPKLEPKYILKYKYNHLTVGNTIHDTYDVNGRTLQIYKYNESTGRAVAHNKTSDAFGIVRLSSILDYTWVSQIKYESTNKYLLDRIEELMTGIIERTQGGGSSQLATSEYVDQQATSAYVGQRSYDRIKSSSNYNPNSKDSIDTLYTVPLDSKSKSKSNIKTPDANKAILSKYPLLTKYNNYYAVAFNYVKMQEKLGKEINVELSNEFTLFAYLWMFNNYVIHVCIDDEETAIAYDEWTVKDDNRHVLVPTHKSLYLLFNYLVTTFKTENKLPFLLTDLEQVLYNENDYMYFQLQQIKDYILKDNYISVIDINDKSSTSKISNYGVIKKLITDMNNKEVAVCEHMNKEGKFDDLLKYAIDNMLTRYGMFYMNTEYLNYIGEDKQSQQLMVKKSNSDTISSDSQKIMTATGNNTTSSLESELTLGGNRRKKSKKHKKLRKYKQSKRRIVYGNKKSPTKRKNTRKYKRLTNVKKTRKYVKSN